MHLHIYLVDKGCEVGHNIFMIARGHGLDLFEELIHGCVPLLQVDPFNGTLLIPGLAISGVNYSGGPNTDDFFDLVVRGIVGP